MELEGTRALVTGGAVRLGRALSLALAEQGCDVCVHYSASAAAAEETVSDIGRLGRRAVGLQADLALPGAAEQLVEQASLALGGLEILVNNAALFLPGGLLDTSPEVFDRQLAVNLRAPFFLSQALAAQLGESRAGAILNIADARVGRTGSDHLAYRLAKGALLTLTRSLALELAPHVRVSCLALGAILPPPGAGEEVLAEIARQRVPLRRSGTAAAVTASAIHLLRSDFLTGVVLPVDGGEYL